LKNTSVFTQGVKEALLWRLLFPNKPLNRRIPHHHPLRKLRVIVDTCLKQMDGDFEAMYGRYAGRESIAPEQLLRTLVLQMPSWLVDGVNVG
jgi:hypothetical protein